MNIPRCEHPNPIFERENWQNLNGVWDFEFDFGKSGFDRKLYEEKSFSKKITVPFCPESKLSGIGYTDFIPCVWYKRSFSVTEKQKSETIFLHFGAVDYKATVYINGKNVGIHKGGYSSFSFDITSFVDIGKNELTICAEDDTRSGTQPRGKQSSLYHSHGCDYTRTTGIWQTVWLEFVPKAHIKNVKYYPDSDSAKLLIKFETTGEGTLTAKASYEGKCVGEVQVHSFGSDGFCEITLSEKHLWEAGIGRLYDLALTYGEDKVKSYFGLRNQRLSDGKFLLNNKVVFLRQVLDQGFYPDGIYTAPSDEALENDIKLSLGFGFNGARLHQKMFEPRFLYHCDKLGYLVWGEHASWGIDYHHPDIAYNYIDEWTETLERDFNHPSIIGWCPFNETWDFGGRKQKDELLATVYKITKQLDSTRPCIDTSGNYHVITDIFDVHDYNQSPKELKECYDKLMTTGELFDRYSNRQHYNGEPVYMSEYGGIRWDYNGTSTGWGYGEAPKTVEEFIARYDGLTTALLENSKMLGFCYTQLYDIEQEINGLCTYDRIPKFDMKVIAEINKKKAKIEE